MEKLDAILQNHIDDPRHGHMPVKSNAHGRAEGDGRSLTMDLWIEEPTISEVSFQGSRQMAPPKSHDVLQGCASFLRVCLRGHVTAFAACVRPFVLAYVLRLAPGDERAQLVVDALRSALADHRIKNLKPRRKKPRGGPIGPPRGLRKHRKLPAPTLKELALLRTGETYEMLMQERAEILGMMQNLEDCLNIGTAVHTFRKDECSRLREDLICLAASVESARGQLSPADNELIRLVGEEGMTESEAAEKLGVSHQAVHKRLWHVAFRIQQVCRRNLPAPHSLE